jgi:hypothetical protein
VAPRPLAFCRGSTFPDTCTGAQRPRSCTRAQHKGLRGLLPAAYAAEVTTQKRTHLVADAAEHLCIVVLSAAILELSHSRLHLQAPGVGAMGDSLQAHSDNVSHKVASRITHLLGRCQVSSTRGLDTCRGRPGDARLGIRKQVH